MKKALEAMLDEAKKRQLNEDVSEEVESIDEGQTSDGKSTGGTGAKAAVLPAASEEKDLQTSDGKLKRKPKFPKEVNTIDKDGTTTVKEAKEADDDENEDEDEDEDEDKEVKSKKSKKSKKDDCDDDDDDDDDMNEEVVEEETEGEVEEEVDPEAIKAAYLDSIKEQSIDISDDLDKIFSGTDLSEEFKNKAKVIYEAALRENINSIADKMFDEILTSSETVVQERTAALEEEYATNLDSLEKVAEEYLEYVTEQWLQENSVAVERSIRTELAEDFIADLKGLLEKHSINLSEEEVTVVNDLTAAKEELEETVNNLLDEIIALRTENVEIKKEQIVEAVASGLTVVEKDRFEKLTEGVMFENAEQFVDDLNTIKDAYFLDEEYTQKSLDEDNDELSVSLEEEVEVNTDQDVVVSGIANAMKNIIR